MDSTRTIPKLARRRMHRTPLAVAIAVWLLALCCGATAGALGAQGPTEAASLRMATTTTTATEAPPSSHALPEVAERTAESGRAAPIAAADVAPAAASGPADEAPAAARPAPAPPVDEPESPRPVTAEPAGPTTTAPTTTTVPPREPEPVVTTTTTTIPTDGPSRPVPYGAGCAGPEAMPCDPDPCPVGYQQTSYVGGEWKCRPG